MTVITLTAEQAKILADATGPVVVVRPDNIGAGWLDPADAVAEAAAVAAIVERRKHAAPGAGIPAAVVMGHLPAFRAEQDRLGRPLSEAEVVAFFAGRSAGG